MNPAILAVGMHGASGRMGTRIIQLIQDDPGVTLAAALDRPDHPRLGEDVGPLVGLGPLGVPLAATLPPDPPVDVVIDFSQPAGALALAEVCAARGLPLVVGTTGFEPEPRAELERAAGRIPLLIAS
ncbi:MAG TPA: 4-hydroxy-tetrahydrodipicolinate reductase, partial [Isosphaeraceae bacterium]